MKPPNGAASLKRLPWQPESSVAKLNRITMIRIFRLRSRSGVPLQRKKSAASRGRYLGVCLSNCFQERTLPNCAPTTTRAALAHQTGPRRGS